MSRPRDKVAAKWISSLGSRPRTLEVCVREGDIAGALKALDKGASPDGEGKRTMTPLTLACNRGDPKMVGLLIDRKASIDKPSAGPDGWQPIFWAVRHPDSSNHVQCVKFLIEHNADINGRDSIGYTPLMRAVDHTKGNKEMITLLLEHKANLEVRGGKYKRSALDIANFRNNAGNAELIKNAIDKKGATDTEEQRGDFKHW